MELIIYGNPVPQGRPKFFRNGDFVGTYDPAKSKNWKETVKWQALALRPGMLDGPLSISLDFHMARPKTLSKKVLHHTKKPDLDNLIKAVKDALTGICYRDDSQITEIRASKTYGDTPSVSIRINPVKRKGEGEGDEV